MYLNPANVEFIAVHCSATSPDMDIGVEEIREWHIKRGWADIGYHFVIRRKPNSLGALIEIGRDISQAGAHVEGYNSRSVGVCLVGGIDTSGKPEANFTQDQLEALIVLLRTLTTSFPRAIIQGHRDFPKVSKSCPCFDVKTWWKETNVSIELSPPKDFGYSWEKYSEGS